MRPRRKRHVFLIHRAIALWTISCSSVMRCSPHSCEFRQSICPQTFSGSAKMSANPYSLGVSELDIAGDNHQYFDLLRLFDGPDRALYDRLPFSIRILLESAVRNCDGFHVRESDVDKILHWESAQHESVEVAFKAARVILQDLTGVPVVVDLAAMRNAVAELGGDATKINPIYPVDLVIDHSVVVDASRTSEALEINERLEYERNQERFQFLKWGARAFQNMLIVPPGSGIVHQVNLEYLARVVFEADKGMLYPDTVVGTDSHTTMINGLGVLGWGVGGIEAEAVMLGQAISMVLPEVVGFKLTGRLLSVATSTDLVLTITAILRKLGVVNKFVEFFGPGCSGLSIADRATISNMAPEYGATCGFFPVDMRTLAYLRETGRTAKKLAVVEAYLKATGMFRDYDKTEQDPVFSSVVELDLSTVVPSISGPKRPHDMVPITNVKDDFEKALTNKVGFKGFGITAEKAKARSPLFYDGADHELTHGDVVIAAITSCTNTSNPSVMLGAGLVAKKAVERGLNVKAYVKTSLSPGSGVATKYLEQSGLTPFLEQLGFAVTGYGCMTCIGNSGPLHESVSTSIEKGDLVVAGVLSGNRNFEGRIHPSTRANYLASPPLVVAYALAGTVSIDFDKEPIGKSPDGTEVYLRDIWPGREEIEFTERQVVHPAMYEEVYGKIEVGTSRWNSLQAEPSVLYPWNENSTYIKYPPYFDGMSLSIKPIEPVRDAHVLLSFGDSITTDHISPAGNIARNSPAARYLTGRGVQPKDFNSYGSRRGHDAVMQRGTFANIRLVNKLITKPGPRTLHFPSGEELDIPDAADRYMDEGIPTIILTGKEYGSGSSRDWAAKGPLLLTRKRMTFEKKFGLDFATELLRANELLFRTRAFREDISKKQSGVRAVIAESYERIHRSNLIGMGIAPLQYLSGQTAETLGLTGRERFSIELHDNIQPGDRVKITTDDGRAFEVLGRFDTEVELTYYRNGGVLNYMVRKMLMTEGGLQT